MTAHETHDRLMAQIKQSQRRLEKFGERCEAMGEETAAAFRVRLEDLRERSSKLLDRAASWTEIEIGLPTAIADLRSAVETLEADADAATDTDASTYQDVVDRQLQAWRGRVDHLRLQGALGAMEIKDDLSEVTSKLEHARGGALVELQQALGDSKGLVEGVRGNVEEVLGDVRHAVERAAAALIVD